MADLIPFKPNQKTYDRMRQKREQEKKRLINKIGVCHQDAPLFSEWIRFLAYCESIGRN
jgi:hypothetical protein